MDIKALYRQVILEHASNPQNKVLQDIKKDYLKKRGYNPTCGDDVTIFLKVKDNKIVDIKHNTIGCSICCASTSILTVEVKGLDFEKAKEKINNFLLMLRNENPNKDLLKGDILALEGVGQFPARVKCASLAWVTVLDIIKDVENE